MNGHSDAVDEVLTTFSNHLDYGMARPTLEHLEPDERQVAQELMLLMETGRWIDPAASTPSLEALLAGTEFADALTPPTATPQPPFLHHVQDVLSGVDARAEVSVDDEGFVWFAYLDLLVRFYPIDSDNPVTPHDTARVLFDADVDVDLVAFVAAHTPELLTLVVSRYDVDTTVSTAASRPYEPSSSPLPLALAARAILEYSAPEWGEFGLVGTTLDVVDLADLQADLATQLAAEEAKRRYQGDKALAYRGLVGHESRLVELVTAATGTGDIDLAAELDRITRQVA